MAAVDRVQLNAMAACDAAREREVLWRVQLNAPAECCERNDRVSGNCGGSARPGIAGVVAVSAAKPPPYAGPSERDPDDQSGKVQNFPPPGNSTEAAHAGRDEPCTEPDSGLSESLCKWRGLMVPA